MAHGIGETNKEERTMAMSAEDAFVQAVAVSEQYTKESLAGAGALKGDKGDPGPKGDKGDPGEGDMLASVYDPNGNVAEAGGIEKYVGARYNIMPDKASLLAMPDNTLILTRGFYDVNDGLGGYYIITTTWTRGSLKINGTWPRYLVPLTSDGRYAEHIEVGRLGLRAYNEAIDWENITPESTYATQNSELLSNIVLPTNRATLKFPAGKFFFASTMAIDRHLNLKGESIGICGKTNHRYSADFSQGTMLVFPFLTNGNYAITSSEGDIENITIVGNPLTYDTAFDRTKANTAPDEVVTETIAMDGETPIKCTGLYKSGGNLSNVYVMNFYTGIYGNISNLFINNVHCAYCHFGLDILNDIKCIGIYGSDVHTLIRMSGAISSVVGLRVDSCVHAVEITQGSGFTLSDIDGDWCTDSLIFLGEEGKQRTIEQSSFSQIHGRCCTLKCYDSQTETSPKASELVNSEGYGIIRVADNTTCKNNYFLIPKIEGRTFDDTGRYQNPNIILTHGNNASINNVTIICPCPPSFADDPEELFETSGVIDFQIKYDNLSDIYYITNDGARILNRLENLTDVDLTSPTQGDVLVYDGQKWVNTPLSQLLS